MVVYEFCVDIYLRGEYVGSSNVVSEITGLDAELLSCGKPEKLSMEAILADMYQRIYEKTIEQEQERYGKQEFPYSSGKEFKEYRFEIRCW